MAHFKYGLRRCELFDAAATTMAALSTTHPATRLVAAYPASLPVELVALLEEAAGDRWSLAPVRGDWSIAVALVEPQRRGRGAVQLVKQAQKPVRRQQRELPPPVGHDQRVRGRERRLQEVDGHEQQERAQLQRPGYAQEQRPR